MNIAPVTLRGRTVRLEPLAVDHVADLARVGLESQLWEWIPHNVSSVEEMRRYVVTALDEQSRGVSLPFAIVDESTDQAVGSTRYANIVAQHNRLEIGWSWIAVSHQRTRANTEAKFLMLCHAFDTLGVNRVELKTDVLNEQSRRAIERLGAVQEGVFRRHVITASGRVRDTVYYAITDVEWPSVKARLETMLDRAIAR
ncbi:MAG TPA: GNAT family protein [Candidatus Baltobacteraceae bacterium]|jgi:RimJ/RimL family protein N-acetyltransferase|nr:GNAT family protein [Candidatus Baltobacteraceae bacterium]